MTSSPPRHSRYQDYVLRDGRMVGDFEAMYQDHQDPWEQTYRETFASDKAVGINLLDRLQSIWGTRRAVEIGCGFGQYTDRIAQAGYAVTGIDIAATAIDKARRRFPDHAFEVGRIDQFDMLKRLDPEVIVMAEVSWYVLDHLQPFIAFIRTELPNTFLLHMLSTYQPGEQKYGREYFTNLEEIKKFFGMHYLECGEVHLYNGQRRNWFLGTWNPEHLGVWARDIEHGRK